ELPAQEFYSGAYNWLFTDMFFSTAALSEIEVRASGGAAPVTQNLDHHYSLSQAAIARLLALGVDAAGLLDLMNARNYSASPEARAYLKQYADFSGRIHFPVLTMH